MVAVAAIVLGGLGAVIGDDTSQGMSKSLAGHSNAIAHIWGVTFAVGGVLKLYGLFTRRVTLELPGLYIVSGGYGFYALTVVPGLGVHGLAAGIVSGSLAVGSLLKAKAIMRRARQVAAESPPDGERP
ncbi:hypothetical protein NE236_32765 [Actinoallomurus purpureus]|uniref:hypothetical protein n=1 Tax=Actinoallomurus purpureus TaxID=478114 RepID=UPI0020936F59|nr:hypothetical protein [Actinoallomurus purpureus]MCO6009754.1 hypothetical protein [Actinoallomurus purpureus]